MKDGVLMIIHIYAKVSTYSRIQCPNKFRQQSEFYYFEQVKFKQQKDGVYFNQSC